MNQWIDRVFDPDNWNRKFFFALGVALLISSLWGQYSALKWLVVHQEHLRLKADIVKIKGAIAENADQIRSFQISSLQQDRMIREKLGYLKKGEISIELIPPRIKK